MQIKELITNETQRNRAFPVSSSRIFLAHAGVTALSATACSAINEFARRAAEDRQENAWAAEQVAGARRAAARMLGCTSEEVSLLGPTALGLNLVAHGLDWQSGDEAVYYPDDYPANVYPWSGLERVGVQPVPLQPRLPGVITWDTIEAALSNRTRLVALASCHFLSGYRLDVETIGARLHERGVLLSVDAIQSMGAFPLDVEHIDFLSADSHKWLLGPCGAGIFYVKASRAEQLRPALLGSWNVTSPRFVAQKTIAFEPGGRRYEPGTLNLPGIAGMRASMELLLDIGIEAVSERILELREHFLSLVQPIGYRLYVEDGDLGAEAAARRSGIISLTHRKLRAGEASRRLTEAGIVFSLRQDRNGETLLRFSPHFYNTEEELARTAEVLEASAK